MHDLLDPRMVNCVGPFAIAGTIVIAMTLWALLTGRYSDRE